MEPGTYTFGPGTGTLTVRTGRGGAAAKAGHDLLLEVTRWRGTLTVGAQPAAELEADARSLRVREATGGMTSLDDDDRAGIQQTIDDEVLKGAPIAFRSSRVEPRGGVLQVSGDLELAGVRRPIAFALDVGDDGRIAGAARVKQTDWRIKPFSALFGTLKVADVVEVAIDAEPMRSENVG
jgi:hypothetical protein